MWGSLPFKGRRVEAWSRGRRSAEEGPQLVGDLTAKAAVAAGGPVRPSRVASPSQAMGPLLRLAGRPACGDATAEARVARDTAACAGLDLSERAAVGTGFEHWPDPSPS